MKLDAEKKTRPVMGGLTVKQPKTPIQIHIYYKVTGPRLNRSMHIGKQYLAHQDIYH
jgi:hypothetical protein